MVTAAKHGFRLTLFWHRMKPIVNQTQRGKKRDTAVCLKDARFQTGVIRTEGKDALRLMDITGEKADELYPRTVCTVINLPDMD